MTISVLAYRQARKTGLVPKRHDAINHALSDVTQHGAVDEETSSALREAYRISLLVFSKKISSNLQKLAGIAFQLQDKEFEQKTEKDLDAEHKLRDDLQKVLEEMQLETAVNKWL